MKKLSVIVLVIVLLLTLAACDPGEFHFEYDELKENVTCVELIYYNNPDAKELFDEKRNHVLPFDFSKMEVVKTLPESKLDDFLHDLSDYFLLMVCTHFDSPQGYSVRVVYSNGDFEILSEYVTFSCGFYADGQVKRLIGMGIGSDLIHQYFD